MRRERTWRIGISVCAVVAAMVAATPAEAQLGSRAAEEWIRTLDSPNRLAGLRVDEVLARLSLAPGQVVVDVGAGTGVFSLAMAKTVAPGGRVYAVAIATSPNSR